MTPPLKIIRSRRKTISLIIQSNGELVVRAPKQATRKQIDALLAKHAAWIEKKQTEALAKQVKTPSHQFVAGEHFLFMGKKFPLKLVAEGDPALSFQDVFYLAEASQPDARAIFEKWYKKAARQLFEKRVHYYAKKHGFQVAKIKLSSAKTRWGSCSSKGNINLVWRLVMAPLEIVDYVIVHELCHLREANHSKRFWAEVEAILPDYRLHRRWLRENAHQLHWE